MLLNILQCTRTPTPQRNIGPNKTVIVCELINSALEIFPNTNQIITVMTKENKIIGKGGHV